MMARAKDILHKMFPASGYRAWWLSYPALLAVMIAELAYMATLGVHEGYDTGGYLDAANTIAGGGLDYFRPPVYPAFLIAVRWLAGTENLYAAVNVAQAVMMIVSAWYFRGICLRLSGGRERTAFWLTVVYCLLPSLQWQVMLVMTEAPTIAATVVLLYWLTRDLPGRMGGKAAAMSAVWLATTVFLRPIMLCMVPVVTVWYAVRRIRVTAWIGLAACVALIAGYTGLMNRLWGIHSFSGVSVANNYCMVCDAGLLYPQHTDNMELRAQMSRIYDGSYVIVEKPLYLKTRDVPDWSEELPAAEIEAAVNRAIAEHPRKLAIHLCYRLWWMVRPQPMLVKTGLPVVRTLEDTFIPTFGLYLLFLAGTGVWLVVRWRRGRPTQTLWLLWLTCMSVTWASLLGAMNNWDRLVLPCIPALILLVYGVLRQWHYSPGKLL